MPYIGTSPSQGVRRVHTYTATANQTSFSGAGAEGATLSYKDSNFVDVYQNGVKLGDADYTATSGTAIVLGTGATVSDLVVIVAYDVFSAADTVSKADGGQFDGAVTFAGGVSGVLDADGGITVDNITIDGTEIDLSSGDLTIDVAGDIILDADGAEIKLKDGGTQFANLYTSSSNFYIQSSVQDKDIIFQGDDGGSGITALTLDMSDAGAATFNGAVTANAGVKVDNITIDGTEIDLSSGNLTIDVAGQLVINSDSGQVVLQDDTVNWGNLQNSSGDFVIESLGTDKDMIFKGLDGSSVITALTLDMSAGGNATFNGSIFSGGNIVVPNGNGIDFSAAGNVGGMDSELLDDYEEGTWTPTVNTGTGYSAQFGRYVKIGKMVFINANVNTSATSSAGNIIQGLPFASSNTGNSAGNLSIGYYATVNVAVVWMGGYVLNNSHNIYIVGNSAGHTGSTIQHNGGSFFSGNSRIMFSGVYEAAS